MKICTQALNVVMAVAALVIVPAAHADTSARQRILFDAGWRFHLDPSVGLTNAVPVAGWRWIPADSATSEVLAAPDIDTRAAGWADVPIGSDLFGGKPGYVWARATLPDMKGPGKTLGFNAVDDSADVYVNGKKLLHHDGWNQPFAVPLDSVWNAGGRNVVAVRIRNTGGGGGIARAVEIGLAPVTKGPTDPLQAGFDDTSWRAVHLPHDYVVEGEFTPQGDASHGSLIPTAAWYRKTFTLPSSDRGKSIWIDFDGVYRNATVYLNGHELGNHPCGYTSYRYDIADAARFGGKNVLAVHVDPTNSEGWWYEGGGIYRHVWLNKASLVHIAPWGTFVASAVRDPLRKPSAQLTITTTISRPPGVIGALVSMVYDPHSKLVAATQTPLSGAAGGARDIVQTAAVPSAQLWSIETPQLYRLHSDVVVSGKVVDTQDTPFGIRAIRWDAEKGFFLNEKPVKIKGTCNHQDFAGVGVAVPDTLEYWRVKRLKAMGSNAWRMSHNPPTPELLDACDRLGMLVMDENRHLGETEAGKASQDTPYADLSELQSMIRRDRNHPSIVLWSMCNEEGIQSTEHGRKIFSAMMDAVRKYDTTRPISCAMNGGYDSPVGITAVEDLQGINYSPSAYEWFHKAHPAMPLYGSETGSTVSTRGDYGWEKFKNDAGSFVGDPDRGYVNAYDVNAPNWAQTAEAAWQPIADRPYVAGGFVWTGFDYKGEPTPFGWPCVNSHFGILDMCGFPKDNYYYYQSVWGDKPMVHVLPHWNWPGMEGKTIPVWAYSNAHDVELFLNGRSLGKKAMPRLGHLEWDVQYAPGKLEARGCDEAGKVIATDTVETAGAPAAIKLTTDRTRIAPDGEDLTVVEVRVVDARGRVIPTADNLISFDVKGAGHIAGVGNGDPSSHEPDRASRRHTFNGLAAVLVGAGERKGAITLTATSPGLAPATMDLEAR